MSRRRTRSSSPWVGTRAIDAPRQAPARLKFKPLSVTPAVVGMRMTSNGHAHDSQTYGAPPGIERFVHAGAHRCMGRDDKAAARGKTLPAAKCRIQLTLHRGKPALRICKRRGEAGELVPVDGPLHAKRLSQQLCACFVKHDARTLAGWKKFKKACLPGKHELGKLRKKR